VLLATLAVASSFRAAVLPSSAVTARSLVQMMAKKTQLTKLTKKELKAKLKSAGLKVSGNKKDLVVRLEQSLIDAALQAKAEVMAEVEAEMPEISEPYDPTAVARVVVGADPAKPQDSDVATSSEEAATSSKLADALQNDIQQALEPRDDAKFRPKDFDLVLDDEAETIPMQPVTKPEPEAVVEASFADLLEESLKADEKAVAEFSAGAEDAVAAVAEDEAPPLPVVLGAAAVVGIGTLAYMAGIDLSSFSI
jgi:hypothetical protein